MSDGERALGTRWLERACLFFVALGVALASMGATPVFAWWRAGIAGDLFGADALPASIERFASVTDGILGGSIAGKWLAAWWLARIPLARGERWAANALLAGLLVWFAIDSATALATGAVFDIWAVNCAPLVAVGVPALALRSRAMRPPAPSSAARASWRWLERACWIYVAVGVVVAFMPRSPFFAPYDRLLESALLGGAATPEAVLWQRALFGAIGGTFAGHFAMLAMAARFAAGHAYALRAVETSIALWFVVDSAACIARGALFNVLIINLPSAATIALLCLWIRRDSASMRSPATTPAPRARRD